MQRSGMLRPTSCALSQVINSNKETESNEDTEPPLQKHFVVAVGFRSLMPLVHSFLSVVNFLSTGSSTVNEVQLHFYLEDVICPRVVHCRLGHDKRDLLRNCPR